MLVKGDLVRFIGRKDEREELEPGTTARISNDQGEGVVYRFNLEGYCSSFAESELELVHGVAELHECECGVCTCYRPAA
ncbi:hypothetical protein GeomeDRAFT_0202 [Geobacter metallireducens RCH3]|uniref:hypothetical protein n=1 Tax=Geobacter TaxID=28231 RepID=UPI00024A147E|nr:MULTISPECIES: hypothetical protein [Geobacter]EHP89404.1 hypothetical protein GeomeDRAFT_0202 [Geobacter metallireducens RCH3]MBT1075754.1 hypothetical protein [Geobacter grbiciae]